VAGWLAVASSQLASWQPAGRARPSQPVLGRQPAGERRTLQSRATNELTPACFRLAGWRHVQKSARVLGNKRGGGGNREESGATGKTGAPTRPPSNPKSARLPRAHSRPRPSQKCPCPCPFHPSTLLPFPPTPTLLLGGSRRRTERGKSSTRDSEDAGAPQKLSTIKWAKRLARSNIKRP